MLHYDHCLTIVIFITEVEKLIPLINGQDEDQNNTEAIKNRQDETQLPQAVSNME
jgi:hypothetical protein